MKKQDKLHELISSMNMSEKRYFKLFAQRSNTKKNKNYLKLFNAIEQLKSYDELVIIQILQRENISTAYLAADKNYLYRLLMRSLRAYNTGKSASLKVKEHLEYVEILYNKGLYDQCFYWLSKAQQLAKKHNLYILLLEVYTWKQKTDSLAFDFLKIKPTETYEIQKQTLAKINNLIEFNFLYNESMFFRKNVPLPSKNLKHNSFEQIMQHELLQNKELLLSLMDHIRFNEIHANYHIYTGNQYNAYTYYKNIIQLLEKYPHFVQENPHNYVVIYSQYLNLQFFAEPLLFKKSLETFRAIPKRISKATTETIVKVFVLSYGLEMNVLLYTHRYREALTLIDTIEKGLKKHKKYIRDEFKMTAYYRFAYTFFVLEKYSEALSYVNKILDELPDKVNPAVYCMTKVLSVLTHFELGNYNLLRYRIKTTVDYLDKRQYLFEAEKIVLHFCKEVVRLEINDMQAHKFVALLKTAYKQLQLLPQNQHQGMYQYFNFLKWLESKLTNASFEDLLKND